MTWVEGRRLTDWATRVTQHSLKNLRKLSNSCVVAYREALYGRPAGAIPILGGGYVKDGSTPHTAWTTSSLGLPGVRTVNTKVFAFLISFFYFPWLVKTCGWWIISLRSLINCGQVFPGWRGQVKCRAMTSCTAAELHTPTRHSWRLFLPSDSCCMQTTLGRVSDSPRAGSNSIAYTDSTRAQKAKFFPPACLVGLKSTVKCKEKHGWRTSCNFRSWSPMLTNSTLLS